METHAALRCPRCPAAPLRERTGSALHDAPCPSCGGTFLPQHGVERVIHQEHGIDVATLRELMGSYAGTRITCPGCSFSMSHVQVKGVALELCTGCGSAWLDDGELHRLSQGRYGEEAGARLLLKEAPALPAPVGTTAESMAHVQPRRRKRFSLVRAIAAAYTSLFGLGLLSLGVHFGAWVFGALGLIACGLGGVVVADGLGLMPQKRRPDLPAGSPTGLPTGERRGEPSEP